MAAAAILKNQKITINQKAPYLGHGSSAFDKIWPDDTVRPS